MTVEFHNSKNSVWNAIQEALQIAGFVIAERHNYLLFDRMVAFHIQHGVAVPMSAAVFYAGLTQRFSERDGMYFLPDQVAEYDRKRMTYY